VLWGDEDVIRSSGDTADVFFRPYSGIYIGPNQVTGEAIDNLDGC
jgi:hypothetical protein